MRNIVLIAHNLRSCHNVGSLLRTAEGLGVHSIWLTGYTPYPLEQDDTRMPHIANKMNTQIHKTALGAEKMIDWHHHDQIDEVISQLKTEGYQIAGLEQSTNTVPLSRFKTPEKIALILGREVEGMEQEIIEQCDLILEIPMRGKKESFNVVQAAAMAMYHFVYV